MTTLKFIKHALEAGVVDDYIVPQRVNQFIKDFASDKRYKLKWLASDCYKQGCSSGIVEYKGNKCYFNMSGTKLMARYS